MCSTGFLAHRYRRFGETEARGVSPLYESLAIAASEDADIMAFVASLPEERQQPNLFLASLRAVAGLLKDAAAMRRAVAEQGPAIRVWMLTHWNQTNEPNRCAVLLPALARIPGPLALIEVGASAGLCLTPDRYGYDYGRATIAPPTPDAPVFPCAASEATPLRVPARATSPGRARPVPRAGALQSRETRGAQADFAR